MPKKIVQVVTESGRSFLAEVEDDDVEMEDGELLPPPGSASISDVFEKITDSSQHLKETVSGATEFVRDAFKSIDGPDEFTMEFSIALKAGGKIPMIVEGSAEAMFKIIVKWSASDSKPV